jgi:integrase
MPRIAKELGPLEVKRLTAPGYHPVGFVPGLNLQVSAAGTKSWVLRCTVGNKRREIGLGAYPGVGLALAREKAQQVRDDIDAGVDPVAQRKQNRQSILETQRQQLALQWTFQAAAEAYIKGAAPGWKNIKHAGQWVNTLETYVYPVIGEMLVSSIKNEHVLRVIEPHWTTKNETISRVRNRIELVLDWAAVRGYRSGSNPARWKGNLDKAGLADRRLVGKVTSHKAVAAAKVFGFMQVLRKLSGFGPRCLEFVVLTACRSGEARLARWSEVDLAERTWNIPGERMKSGRPHRVPLSDEVVSLLENLQRMDGTDLLFPGRNPAKPISDMTMTKIMRDMNADAVPHGFRSTFSSWTASSTAYPFEVREMALAHAIGDGTVAAYQRSDLFEKRRNLMADWAKFTQTAPVVGNNVLPMHKAA